MWNEISCAKLQLLPETLTRGLPPPDPILSVPCPQLNLLNPSSPSRTKFLVTPLSVGPILNLIYCPPSLIYYTQNLSCFLLTSRPVIYSFHHKHRITKMSAYCMSQFQRVPGWYSRYSDSPQVWGFGGSNAAVGHILHTRCTWFFWWPSSS
jgi:hypothetical protein